MCVCGEWELKTYGTNQDRPRLAWCLHIHTKLSPQIGATVFWNYQKNVCGCLFSLDLAHGDFHLCGSLKKHFEGNYMSCCWDESWGMTVSANSELLFLLCGDWTHGALLRHISVILAWRNRRSTCYSLLFWILRWSNWYECNTPMDGTYWTACVYSGSYHIHIAEWSVFVATY